MTSIVRSSGVASKLIAGFPTSGVTAAVPTSVVHKINAGDGSSALLTNDTLRAFVVNSAKKGLLSTKAISVTNVRLAHTDVEYPNFDSYRLEATKDPQKSSADTEDDRRGLADSIRYGVGGVLTLLAARNAAQTVVYYKAMAADQRALASIEIDLNEVPEGQTKTFEWRGKPVFVKHRTPAEIQREKSVNLADLRHAEHDDARVQRDEWSIVIGVCTHLGCVPIAGSGDFGGYYCPCHGSHYDGSGRIRRGPAPLNLNIPPYVFKGDKVVVGTD